MDHKMKTAMLADTKLAVRLTEGQMNVSETLLEQIKGCAELINSHVDTIAQDIALMTAVMVIQEKADAVTEILRAGYERP